MGILNGENNQYLKSKPVFDTFQQSFFFNPYENTI